MDTISLLTSLLLGFIIGVERASKGKPASIKTFTIVCYAACLFTLLSIKDTSDPSKIISNVVSAIGFLGGSIIFKTKDRYEGITTAALLWFTTAIGVACGYHEYYFALFSVFVYILILIVGKKFHEIVDEKLND